jgi:phosphoketolase
MKHHDTLTEEKATELAGHYRLREPEFARWALGYGVIRHSDLTQSRIHELAARLGAEGIKGDGVGFYDLLYALDRVASAGLWLVVHQTYARRVYLDGRRLGPEDFKVRPDGHTGGSLNMVPAYAGYLGANVLAGLTRAWLMGQGHCVSAVDSLNLIVGNLTAAHSARYSLTDEGLSRYVEDFYAYRIGSGGHPASPLGSHVNANTSGSLAEGGYLGFAEIEYIHMPLRGEHLVAFLSDGAFEEQRGSDWAPRWWRAEDSGLVAPIMIANGRRIDQRTTMSQSGGVDWFVQHLRLNGFEPIVFDGRDPAAFVWAIFELEHRLTMAAEAVQSGKHQYPVRLPYGIAVAPKGAGFPGEGTNLAHNLPLMANPRTEPMAASLFNEGARKLWVPQEDLREAITRFQRQRQSGRPLERDHALAHRDVRLESVPPPPFRPVDERRREPAKWTTASPMTAVDEMFSELVTVNPHLRPRVGNPDEMRSNRLIKTLDLLKFRVTAPEPDVPEAVEGAVITALNEEAVAAAALANKGGINLVHTYEAFGMKMHGIFRQEIIFANHCEDAGRPQRWLSVPLCLTSHTWENGKNEQSHQDPSLAEAMLGEPSSLSRVVFPADFNSGAATMERVYQTHGQFWFVVIPKADSLPDLFSGDEARRLIEQGGMRLDWAGYQPREARLLLIAVGAYQLAEMLLASRRLADRRVPHAVSYVFEPGRFRDSRSAREEQHLSPVSIREEVFGTSTPMIIMTHTRPEPVIGCWRSLQGRRIRLMGYRNQGGTLNTPGMLYVNRSTWAHCLLDAAALLEVSAEQLLTAAEREALDGRRDPHGIIIPEVGHDKPHRDRVGPTP